MFVCLHTLVYASDKANIDELMEVRRQITRVYGKEFVDASYSDLNNINEVIRDNINLIMPESGRKIGRLVEIAKEEGIMYQPSEIYQAVTKKIRRKIIRNTQSINLQKLEKCQTADLRKF